MLGKKYYKIELDIKKNTAKYPDLIFYKSDVETSDFFIEIKRDGVVLDLTDNVITLSVKKPNSNYKTKELNFDNKINLIYCNLTKELKDITGRYSADITIKNKENEIIVSNSFVYYINDDITSKFTSEVENSEELPFLQQLMKDVKDNAEELSEAMKQTMGELTKDVQKVNNIDDVNKAKTKTYSSEKIEEKFNGVSSQIKDIDSLVKENVNEINILLSNKTDKDKLGFYVADDLPDFDINNSQIAINKALEEGKHVKLLEKTYFITGPIVLRTENKLSGYGKKSLFRIANGVSTECITLLKDDVKNIQLEYFSICGNITNPGTDMKDAIKIENSFSVDCKHTIKNIDIFNHHGNGFVIKGSGESFIQDIRVVNCSGKGFEVGTVDNFYSGLSSGVTEGIGIDVDGNSNRFINCKAWYGLKGIRVKGGRNSFIACESQDNLQLGIEVTGWENKFDIIVDTVGTKDGSEIYNGACAIQLNSDSGRNIIKGQVGDRRGYIEEGTLDYVLDIDSNSTGNDIDIVCSSVKVHALKNQTYKDTNTIKINGSMLDYSLVRVSSYSKPSQTIILKSNITTVSDNSILKERNIIQLKLIAGGTNLASGKIIGTVPSSYIPIVYSGLSCYCLDSNSALLGVGVADISNSDGNITLWNIPSGTTKLNIFGTYICKDRV